MDIGLEESRAIWKDLGSRRIRKSLEMKLELCNDLKLELRLQLRQKLEKVKGRCISGKV